jgi:hypothetical protein
MRTNGGTQKTDAEAVTWMLALVQPNMTVMFAQSVLTSAF